MNYRRMSDMLPNLKHKIGVYQIFDKDLNLIYIGKSNNLKARLVSSTRYKIIGEYVSVAIIDNSEHADTIETRLILDNNFPLLNKGLDAKNAKCINKPYPFIPTFSDKYFIDIEQKEMFCAFELIKDVVTRKISKVFHINPEFLDKQDMLIPEHINVDEQIFNNVKI